MNLFLVIFQLYFLVNPLINGFEYQDLVTKAVFPPPILDNNSDPVGHKKPLGWQRAPEGPIKEYANPLDAQNFWKTHVKPHKPLVYRGVIKDSPAISLWNDEYLAEKYGDLDVLVEHKKEDRTSTSGRMRLSDFLKHYKEDDLYIVTMFPKEMMHQVRAINSVLCGTFRNYTHESNLWVSAGGTRSVVHYDADHNLHCVIDGRKDFIMIPNNLKTKTNLYFKQKDPSVGSGFSFLNPDIIDMKKFPRIAQVPWTWASLYPGDCIFIPSKYIHQVRGYGRTVAVTTLFTADIKNNFNSDDCTEELMSQNYTMADIDFLWTYKKGDATIDMGYMNTELVKTSLLTELQENQSEFAKNGKMSMKQFIYFSGAFSPYGRNKTKITHIWKEVFGLKETDYMDPEKVNNLSLDQLRKYCRVIEAPHGVVTDGTEPVFVRPGERHKWEREHPDEDENNALEDEEEIQQIASRDNMLEHLSPEEMEEYIKEKMEEKKKFGLRYDIDEDFLKPDTLSEEKKILMELSWRIEDIPKKYQKAIRNGKIPKQFRDEFVEALPESLQERYKDYFQDYRLPDDLVKALVIESGSEYKEKVLKELNEENEKVKYTIKDEF